MKIVQINAIYGRGSTGIIVKDIQTACRNAGIDCVVAYPKSVGIVTNGYLMGNTISNKLHALLARISGKQGYFSYFSTWRFLRFLDNYQPDILHLHNLHGCFINVPMLLKYAVQNDVAVVVSLHDCWFYTGGCSHYTSVGCHKWRDQCGKCPRRYDETQAIFWDGSKQMLKDRNRLFGAVKKLYAVGVSKWIVEEAQKTVFKNARCLAIHNGVDTEFFYPTRSDFRARHNLGGKFIILAPANKWFLAVNKETLEYFASHMTEDEVMVFIGAGAPLTSLPKNMVSLGFISSREELRGIYSAADVMVNCTREESLSLLNIEVQACGTPVITYANTGVKETVDGKCGFAVENGNPEEMWKAVERIYLDGKSSYSSSCIQWVEANFSKDRNYKKYIDLYLSII